MININEEVNTLIHILYLCQPSYTVVVFSGGSTVLLKGSTYEFTDKTSFTNKVSTHIFV